MSEAPETILSSSPVVLETTAVLPSPSPVEPEPVACLPRLRVADDGVDTSPRSSEGVASSDEAKSDEVSSGFEGPEKVRFPCFRMAWSLDALVCFSTTVYGVFAPPASLVPGTLICRISFKFYPLF
jgi:hypothetical protein